jgi:hypothetical protein
MGWPRPIASRRWRGVIFGFAAQPHATVFGALPAFIGPDQDQFALDIRESAE